MKEQTSITIDFDLKKRAEEHKINFSGLMESALLRELEIYEHSSYMKALELQNTALKDFINSKNLALEWEEFKLKNIKI